MPKTQPARIEVRIVITKSTNDKAHLLIVIYLRGVGIIVINSFDIVSLCPTVPPYYVILKIVITRLTIPNKKQRPQIR